VKSGRAARDAERLAKHREEREAAKVKARTTRIDPRVESITVGTKQVWKDSQEEANWCKLSTKFFTFEKIKKIKVTIDCRFKIKSIKYRTDIHFDDITHILISDDLKTMSIETRIPTLFEIGTPVSNSDGALSIDWQEGRGLDWQQPAKNPHPNRYVFVFRDGAFKEDSLATFMNSDPRIKALIQKENVALADFQRGSKRSRDEVDSKPAKASSSSTEGEKTAKKDGLKKSASSTEVDQTKSKPAQKKQKISEKEAVPVKSDAPSTEKGLKKTDSKKAVKATSSSEPKAATEEKAPANKTAKSTATTTKTEDTKPKSDAMDVDEAPSKSPKPKVAAKTAGEKTPKSPNGAAAKDNKKKPVVKTK
jgi:hypothetical protein